jgi:hypothetical protein
MSLQQFKGIDCNKQYYINNTKGLFVVENGIIIKEVKNKDLDKMLGIKRGNIQTSIVSYDLESVYDKDEVGLLKSYSNAYTRDFKEKRNCCFKMGKECVGHMLDCLLKNVKDTKYCLLGYNSSKFDNIFLLPELLKKDKLCNVFYQKNSVLNINWKGGTVHDICRFTQCSLEKACDDFKTKFRKVEDFEHFLVQDHYN